MTMRLFVVNNFAPPASFQKLRRLMPATDYRAERTRTFQAWHDICGVKAAA
jgi:hypothetical protein